MSVLAPFIRAGGRAAATAFEFKLALPPVATRNGLASPVRIGAPPGVLLPKEAFFPFASVAKLQPDSRRF
jgi:hypothetical protein